MGFRHDPRLSVCMQTPLSTMSRRMNSTAHRKRNLRGCNRTPKEHTQTHMHTHTLHTTHMRAHTHAHRERWENYKTFTSDVCKSFASWNIVDYQCETRKKAHISKSTTTSKRRGEKSTCVHIYPISMPPSSLWCHSVDTTLKSVEATDHETFTSVPRK